MSKKKLINENFDSIPNNFSHSDAGNEPFYYYLLDNFSNFCDIDKSPINEIPFLPKNINFRYVVNTTKAATFFLFLIAMFYFNNFSKASWVYLSLHGSYGFVWLIKDLSFPEKGFNVKINILAAIAALFFIFTYYMIPYIVLSGECEQNPSNERIFSCYFIYVLGICIMVTTDVQKYITLNFDEDFKNLSSLYNNKEKKKPKLIKEKMLAYNRNTNYFGEMLIYGSFALLTNTVLAFMVLLFVWTFAFVSRIWLKERSLMKKEGYKEYKNNSYLFLFKIFNNDALNIIFYSFIFYLSYYLNKSNGLQNLIFNFK